MVDAPVGIESHPVEDIGIEIPSGGIDRRGREAHRGALIGQHHVLELLAAARSHESPQGRRSESRPGVDLGLHGETLLWGALVDPGSPWFLNWGKGAGKDPRF